jgi:hypothetical protein
MKHIVMSDGVHILFCFILLILSSNFSKKSANFDQTANEYITVDRQDPALFTYLHIQIPIWRKHESSTFLATQTSLNTHS